MLFVKYVSDSWTEHYAQLQEQYGDDRERILLRLERERFVLPADCRFDDVLNIPRYVDTFEEEESIDIGAVQVKIDGLEEELSKVKFRMVGYLEELGL